MSVIERPGRAALRPAQGFERWLVGATLVPLVLFSGFHVAGGTPSWLIGLSLLLGAPHVMATLGLYADPGLRPVIRADRRWLVWAPLAVIAVSGLAFVAVTGPAALLVLTAFLLWQTQHYTKQNVGVFGLWVRARGELPMADPERRLIVATTAIGTVGILRAMELAPWWDRALQVGGLALTATMLVLAGMLARGPRRLALMLAVAFYAPLVLFSTNLLGAAFAYQAAHGAQYYVVVARTIRGQHQAQRVALVSVLVGGTVAILLLSSATFTSAPVLFGLGKGIAAAHFVADARLWRLRDPQIRGLLTARMPFLAAPAPALASAR